MRNRSGCMWRRPSSSRISDSQTVASLAERRPPGAEETYGSGHRQATGGALRPADWNAFVAGLGFPEEQVPA